MNLILKYCLLCLAVLAVLSLPLSAQKVGVETLKYKFHLGWFNVGDGTMTTTNDEKSPSGVPCKKVHLFVQTMGLGNWLGGLKDNYTSCICDAPIKSLYEEKHVVAGQGMWDQWSTFNYDSMKVFVKVKDSRKPDPNLAWSVKMEKNTQDLLGTYTYFRMYNWNSVKVGDSVMINTFYERKLYHIGIQFMGKKVIEFNGKDVSVYKLHLLLPHNENLKKDRPVEIYITADKNQYPILIETRLPFLGKGHIDLVDLNGKAYE